MTALDERALAVTKFWREAGEDAWFEKNDAFDADFRSRFLDLHYAAARRECDAWSEHAEGSLALMILLDQFPRNCFRGSGHMYATDPLARHFAAKATSQDAISSNNPAELARLVVGYSPSSGEEHR